MRIRAEALRIIAAVYSAAEATETSEQWFQPAHMTSFRFILFLIELKDIERQYIFLFELALMFVDVSVSYS